MTVIVIVVANAANKRLKEVKKKDQPGDGKSPSHLSK